jgi:type IV secretion system protein VirB6
MEASGGDAMDNNTSLFSPPGLLWAGGTMLLLGTVGVLATCKIALAILMGLGPIFIVMALFDGTKGLFVGWLKGVVLMALAPLFAVLGGSLMLELAIPVLSGLAATPGKIDVRPAMAFFMIGAVHLALMFMILRVVSTMVSGWTVFGFARPAASEDRAPAPVVLPAPAPVLSPANGGNTAQARALAAAPAPARDIRLPSSAPLAANDTGGGGTSRETRIISTGGATGADRNAAPLGGSRARGIGSRFKSAPARKAASSSEKLS